MGYAALNGFAIVTADADFVAMAESLGPPPQVIRLKNCNYKTARVGDLLRRNAIRIADLVRSGRAMLIVRNLL
jgi:predicted nuclease of predicted toxin-antitoxin system